MKASQMEWATIDAGTASALMANRKLALSFSGRRVRLGAKSGNFELSDKGPMACWDQGAKQLLTAELLAGLHIAVDPDAVEKHGTLATSAGGLSPLPVVEMDAAARAIFDNFMAGVARREAAAVEAQARADRVASLRATARAVQGLPPETVAPVAAASVPMDARSVRERELRGIGASVSGAQPKVEAATVDPAKMTDREKRVAELRALGASVR